MTTLVLPLKGIFFDQIKAGVKTEEYRLVNRYWSRRLEFGSYDTITLTRGYPARDDASRRMVLPWRGFTVKTIQHEHFGPEPVEVFAINVSDIRGAK